MTLSFASSPGNLFNRWGKLGLLVKQAKAYQASQLTNFTDVTSGAVAQYNSESDIQALIGAAYIGQLDTPGGVVGPLAADVAQQTLNRMIFRDNPQLGQTLTSGDTVINLRELIRQMGVQGASVLAMVITATPGSFVGTGAGALVASTRRAIDGKVQELTYTENVKLTCVADSYTGGVQAGNESFVVTGTGAQNNIWAFNWPLGSNCSTSLSAIDGDTDDGAGNLLTNSGFSSWTGNTPDNYTIDVGTAGVQVFEETGIVYGDTGSALKITGDGSTLVTISQQFDISTGTTGTLDGQTQYAFNVWCRRDGTAPAAGQMIIEVVDENLDPLMDASGNAASMTIDLTALTTVYTPYGFSFQTPENMPSTYYWRFRTPAGNALTNGRSVYFDLAALGNTTQCYLSGPALALFSGQVPFTIGDYVTCQFSNARGSGGTLSTFQTFVAQCFPEMYSNELLLLSSSVPTISDSLIG